MIIMSKLNRIRRTEKGFLTLLQTNHKNPTILHHDNESSYGSEYTKHFKNFQLCADIFIFIRTDHNKTVLLL